MYRFACNQSKWACIGKGPAEGDESIEQLEYAPNTLARNFRTTDRKSLFAFRAVGPKSEAESVRPMRAE